MFGLYPTAVWRRISSSKLFAIFSACAREGFEKFRELRRPCGMGVCSNKPEGETEDRNDSKSVASS